MNKMTIGALVTVAVTVVGVVLLTQGQLSQAAYANTQAANQNTFAANQAANAAANLQTVTVADEAAFTESFVTGEKPVVSAERLAQANPRPQTISTQVVTPRAQQTTKQNAAANQKKPVAQQTAAQNAKTQAASKTATTARPQTTTATAKVGVAAQPVAVASFAPAEATAVDAATDGFAAFEAAFVAADASFNDISAAQEQAVQDVKETEDVLSPSAPTL